MWRFSSIARARIRETRSASSRVRGRRSRQASGASVGSRGGLRRSATSGRSDSRLRPSSQTRGLVHCSHWKRTSELTIDADVAGGVYALRLETHPEPARSTEAIFTVLPRAEPDVLVVLPSTTWAAYNWWGRPLALRRQRLQRVATRLPGFVRPTDEALRPATVGAPAGAPVLHLGASARRVGRAAGLGRRLRDEPRPARSQAARREDRHLRRLRRVLGARR
jgi:hypothetical protein